LCSHPLLNHLMRREFFFLFTFIILSHTLKGQISHGGQPLPLNTDADVRVFAPAADLFIDMPKFNEQEALWRSGLENSKFKRLNMYLRWMVRDDDKGVDFGLWKRIPQSSLICPIDVHVDRTARKLGLITRKQTDWKTALELYENLRLLDNDDPAKYDFALFGLSIEKVF
jgi:hypothetical protein